MARGASSTGKGVRRAALDRQARVGVQERFLFFTYDPGSNAAIRVSNGGAYTPLSRAWLQWLPP